MASYKRLLLLAAVMCWTTQAFYVVKGCVSVIKVRTDVADISTICRYDLEVRPTPIQNDHDYTDAPNFHYLSVYKVASFG